MYNTTRVPDSCCLEFSENCGLHSPGTWWKAVSSSVAHSSSCLAALVKGRQVVICRAVQMISCAPHSSILIQLSSGAFRRLLLSCGLSPPYLVIFMSWFSFSRLQAVVSHCRQVCSNTDLQHRVVTSSYEMTGMSFLVSHLLESGSNKGKWFMHTHRPWSSSRSLSLPRQS